MIPQIILSTELTKAFIYPALRAEPGEAWLQAEWNIELTLATRQISYILRQNMYSPFQQFHIWPVHFQHIFLSFSWSLTQTDVRTKWIHTPILLESCASLRKLWGAAGVVRGFQYQIGRKDYIHTRLKHHHSLLGILTIISLVLQGCGTDGGQGFWRQRRGQKASGVVRVMSSSWIPVCHIAITIACQANVLTDIRYLTVWDMASTILCHLTSFRIPCSFCFILRPRPQRQWLMPLLKLL